MDVQKKFLIQYQFTVLKKIINVIKLGAERNILNWQSIYEKSTTYNMLSSEILKLFPKVWEADKEVYFHHSCLLFYWSFNYCIKAR